MRTVKVEINGKLEDVIIPFSVPEGIVLRDCRTGELIDSGDTKPAMDPVDATAHHDSHPAQTTADSLSSDNQSNSKTLPEQPETLEHNQS
jgi:hypothetical protein